MNSLLFVAINVTVAAVIGGVTNHVAIKMLFHPRRKLSVFGRRLPFTPGLIPKRKDEIAASLGNVVADYLVTPQGLAALLNRFEFRQKVQSDALRLFREWSGKDAAIARTFAEWLGEARWEAWKMAAAGGLEAVFARLVRYIWEDRGLAQKTLPELIHGWHEGTKEAAAERAARYASTVIDAFLQSAEADRLLRKLLPGLMERAGGFLGSLAGLFLDEDKLQAKVRAALLDMVRSSGFRDSVRQAVMKELDKLESMELSVLLEKITDGDPIDLLLQTIGGQKSWETRIGELTSRTFAEAFAPFREFGEQVVPRLTDVLLQVLAGNAEKIMRVIRLPQLVEEEVGKFPVERLEDIILSVSGKEFRAITWLGAALGGIIGLAQSLLLIWYNSSGF